MSSRTLELPGTLVAGAVAPVSAGLAVRLAATAIDLVIVGTVAVVAGLAAHAVIALLPAAVEQAENWGLGPSACRPDGVFRLLLGRRRRDSGQEAHGPDADPAGNPEHRAPIGPGRALLRLIGITAGNILFVDLIVAFLHRDRRALHDLIADSIVVEAR